MPDAETHQAPGEQHGLRPEEQCHHSRVRAILVSRTVGRQSLWAAHN
jgi:hypothetical protein